MNIFQRFFNLNYALFWEKPEPKQDPEIVRFTENLLSRGYEYNKELNRFERTWTTNNGKESALECYELVDNTHWKVTMYGTTGEEFFTQTYPSFQG